MLAVMFAYVCKAQDAAELSHSTATCNYNLFSQNAWSSACNPAGISDIKKLTFGVLFQNHFLLKDLSTQYISAAAPLNKHISYCSSLFRFGNNLYSKNEWNNALSIKLNEKLWNKEDKLLKSKLEKRLFYKLADALPSKVFDNTNECDKVKHF